jgi:glycosyltransferase involved in cell wall biosynthesis
MRHKRVLFLSANWQADHPMLLRWKHYYESRGLTFFSLHVNWNIYYADRKSKLRQYVSLVTSLLRNRIFFIHANDLASGMAAVFLKKFSFFPFVYDAHEIFSHELPAESEDAFYRQKKAQAEKTILSTADFVVVPNKQRIQFFQQFHRGLEAVQYSLVENKSLTAYTIPVSTVFTKQLMQHQCSLFYGGSFWYGRKQDEFPLLGQALACNKIKFVLSGGCNEYLNTLLKEPGTQYLGNIPAEQYCSFIEHISIGLAWYFPTTINDELCAPLKIFDYLANGKPVLAARLPYLVELSERYPGIITFFEAGNWLECCEKAVEVTQRYTFIKQKLAAVSPKVFTWESQYNAIDQEFLKANIELCAE